jgi:hypothetical protein
MVESPEAIAARQKADADFAKAMQPGGAIYEANKAAAAIPYAQKPERNNPANPEEIYNRDCCVKIKGGASPGTAGCSAPGDGGRGDYIQSLVSSGNCKETEKPAWAQGGGGGPHF